MAEKHSTNHRAQERKARQEAFRFSQEAALLLAQPNVRALLVTLNEDGSLAHQAVQFGQSVLDIRTELQDHLSAAPFDTAFLESLRDYCEGSLAASEEARRTGGFVIPRSPGRWEIAHVNAFQPLEVPHA